MEYLTRMVFLDEVLRYDLFGLLLTYRRFGCGGGGRLRVCLFLRRLLRVILPLHLLGRLWP